MAITQEKLIERYAKIVDAYFQNGFNQTRALETAGYKHANAYVERLFKHPWIVGEIARRQAVAREKYELDEEWIVSRLMRIADAGTILARYKKVEPDGSLSWDFTGAPQEDLALINELTVEVYMDGRGEHKREVKRMKIGITEPKGALETLGRRFGLWKDNVTVTGEVSLIDRINKGRERIRGPVVDAAFEQVGIEKPKKEVKDASV